MGWSLGNNTVVGSSDTNTVTSAAIDTTDATLIVVALSSYGSQTRPVISDSKGNTWVALTNSQGTYVRQTLFYCIPTSVGSGHTFTATQNGAYPAFVVAAFSGAVPVFDQQNGALDQSGGATTLATGSVTPSENNELIVTGAGGNNVDEAPVSIDSGFTGITGLYGTPTHFGVSMAYQIQTTATTRNPTWTWGGADVPIELAARIATFKVGATGNFFLFFSLLLALFLKG